MEIEIIKSNLCQYDLRNPDGISDIPNWEDYYEQEEIEQFGNFAREDCYCDNCFCGRTILAEKLLKHYENL